MKRILRTWFALATVGLIGCLFVTSPTHAQPIQGVGDLKFGMTPAEVTAIEACSSQTECMYEILGKNRYFKLVYRSEPESPDAPSSSQTPPGTLSLVDIDMGNYTREWFWEVYEVLALQFPVNHSPTEQEDSLFQQGSHHELIFGLADGFVLLKIVRRPFGNLIIRVVYQDAANAKVQRALWNASPAS